MTPVLASLKCCLPVPEASRDFPWRLNARSVKSVGLVFFPKNPGAGSSPIFLPLSANWPHQPILKKRSVLWTLESMHLSTVQSSLLCLSFVFHAFISLFKGYLTCQTVFKMKNELGKCRLAIANRSSLTNTKTSFCSLREAFQHRSSYCVLPGG